MTAGIDASNIRAGGGVTNLVETLNAARPSVSGFRSVVVWSGRATLARLPEMDWLIKEHVPALDRSSLFAEVWRRKDLPRLAREQVDVLFAPGGLTTRRTVPTVVQSQNQLPFVSEESRRFGLTKTRLRYLVLRWKQARSFRRSDGLIVLTDSAHQRIVDSIGPLQCGVRKIASGIDPAFLAERETYRPIGSCDEDNPFRILYVSTVSLYKHQWHVVEAIGELRRSGYPVRLDLVGPAAHGLDRLEATMDRVDPDRSFVQYHGRVAHSELPRTYRDADLFVFASSCESLPNILVEAMASSCPVASSDRGPMPEVLGDAGVYFDPESPDSIAAAVEGLIRSPETRTRLAARAYEKAHGYSWERCADETFEFLAEIARRDRQSAS